MRDQYDDLVFQAGRSQLGEDIARLARSIGSVFELLTAQLYDAPWTRTRERDCKGRYTIV